MQEIKMTYLLTQIKRWALADASVTFDFGDYGTEYLIIYPRFVYQLQLSLIEPTYMPGSEQIVDLVTGYIDITLKVKSEPGKLPGEVRQKE